MPADLVIVLREIDRAIEDMQAIATALRTFGPHDESLQVAALWESMGRIQSLVRLLVAKALHDMEAR